MFNKNQVLEIIASNENVYFTSEDGNVAEKNALESLTATSEKSTLKYLGSYDGEDFETEDYQVVDGDSIYVLV